MATRKVERFKPKPYNHTMTNISKYMSVKDFAEIAAVSVQAVHKAIKAGRVKDFKRIGYVYLINRAEAKKFGGSQ